MDWGQLGYLSGPTVKEVRGKRSTLSEVFAGKLASAVRDAWSELPLVVRVRTWTGAKTQRKHHPTRILDLAPPAPTMDRLGPQGSFILLDTAHRPGRLVLVMYDWDRLELSTHALGALGIDASAIVRQLVAHERRREVPSRRIPKKRWIVQATDDRVIIHTGVIQRDDVSPVVGRLPIGELPWPGQSDRHAKLTIEVLALPRLSDSSSVARELVPLGDADEADAFLRATAWRTGSPRGLLALLQLAHSVDLHLDPHQVRMSSTENPSPLAWLALADTLEKAADHQRRQYTRCREVAGAPVGTLRFNAYMSNLARQRPDLVPVDRFVLSHDTLENRLFRGVATWVRRRTPSVDLLGSWIAQRFSTLEARFHRAQPVEPAIWMCRALREKELPEPLAQAVEHCEAVLTGRYAGVALDHADFTRAQSFEIDIAELFESAMRTVLAQSLGRPVLDGNVVQLTHTLQWEGESVGSISLKPDFVAVQGAVMTVLGDAKYKRPRRPGGSAASTYAPLGRSDFHQLSTYLLAWPTAARAVVLIPSDRTEGPATRQLAHLRVGDTQDLAVFEVSPERWSPRGVYGEPLTTWLTGDLD